MRDALFMGSTWRALKIPVTFMAGFQSLALGVLKQPLCWAPLLPEAQFLLRISGRVTIIPLSPTCTWHKPPSGLSSVLLIVKPVSLFFAFSPSLFSFSSGYLFCGAQLHQLLMLGKKCHCIGLLEVFQRWEREYPPFTQFPCEMGTAGTSSTGWKVWRAQHSAKSQQGKVILNLDLRAWVQTLHLQISC